MIMKEKIICSRCNGYGEIMKRDRYIDLDGSEDISGTPYVATCPRCKGEGKI